MRQTLKHIGQAFKTAFEEIKGYPIAGPRPPKASLMGDSDGSDRLTDCFQREVLEVVDGICNKLLNTTTLQEADVPERVFLGKASDEDLGNADYSWSPKYVVRAKPVDSDEETRLIGHVEYMGGRPGALTRAIKEVTRNSWGSLRCVLGKLEVWGDFCQANGTLTGSNRRHIPVDAHGQHPLCLPHHQ